MPRWSSLHCISDKMHIEIAATTVCYLMTLIL